MQKEFPERKAPEIKTVSSDDPRSYRISSEKIKRELNFVPKHTIEEAVKDLLEAFSAGKLPGSLDNRRYYNIKTMKAINLK